MSRDGEKRLHEVRQQPEPLDDNAALAWEGDTLAWVGPARDLPAEFADEPTETAWGRLVVPGRQPIGLLATALIGIAGSLLGGDIGRAAHLGGVLQFVLAVLVAAGLVVVYSRWQASRTH